jgi:hypothetical protein
VSRSKLRLGALLLGCGLLLGSCASAAEVKRGVGVRSINTDIGLGINPESAAAPANTVVRTETGSTGIQQPPEITVPPLSFYSPPPSIKMKCPVAGAFEFPAVEAGVEPTGRPVATNYPYKIDGTVDAGGGPYPVDTFETRTIKDVQDSPAGPGAFRYTQIQRYSADQRVTGEISTVLRVVPQSPAQTDRTNSDAGRGIFIESISFKGKDRNGNLVESTFNPQPAVQMIAFPVVQGGGVAGQAPQTGTPVTSSSGTDPSNGSSLTLTGNVKGKKQVDACGKKVDSWLVDTTQRFTYNDGNGQRETLESRYRYAFAIQYGSILVYERTEAPKDGPVITIDSRIGQIPKGPGK